LVSNPRDTEQEKTKLFLFLSYFPSKDEELKPENMIDFEDFLRFFFWWGIRSREGEGGGGVSRRSRGREREF
jgi:hypothetical protein